MSEQEQHEQEPVADEQQEQQEVHDEQEPVVDEQEGHDEQDEQDGQQDTFPRSYVEKLRRESAEHRTRAAKADELAAALWSTRVAATGKLADPTDLPMPADVDPLDAAVIDAAVAELLARKPHLAARVPRGNAGQGYEQAPTAFSLGAALRAGAV